MENSNRPACDCLNWCGDDPWLRDGRAEFCDEHKKRVAAALALQERRAFVIDRMSGLAASALEHGVVVLDAEVAASLRDAVLQLIK